MKAEDTDIEDYANFKGPSLLKRTLGLQRRHHGLHVGGSGRIEPALTRSNRSLDTTKAPRDISFRHVSERDMFVLCPDQGTEFYEDELDDLDAIENLVAPHGRSLINLYFRIVHPSFPILHKRVYLEKYERSYREFSPVLLAAVYILATNYWSYSPELSGSPLPNVKSLDGLALKSMNYAIHRPKISTVEAGLLLLQRASETSWPLTAQMVAIGQDLGLHRDCSDWDIPGWEKGLRKRLAWALFMQDKWASLVQGRPSHIHKTDWGVQPLVEQDFPENVADENEEDGSTEVEKGRKLFTCMVSLTQILSDILASLYSGAAEEDFSRHQHNVTTSVLMKAKPLQIRLKEWCAKLPHCLSIEHIKLRKLSSSGYLHLAYWATEISLHRCIIRTLATCTNRELVGICQQAALARSKSAMEFVKNLKPEHWQSFWYFASEYSFGLIGVFETLLSTALVSENDIRASMSRLDQYQWALKVSRKNAGFLDKSIAMMEFSAKHSKQWVSRTDSTSEEPQGSQTEQTTKLHLGFLEPLDYPYMNYLESPSRPYHPNTSGTESDSYQDLNHDVFFDMDLGIEHSFTEDIVAFDEPLDSIN